MIKILIADDEIPEQRLLSTTLHTAFPGEVILHCVSNGKEAVDDVTLWSPDVVLLDIEMPVMNGLVAAKHITEISGGCRIIFITAYSLFEYAQEAVKLRAIDYILKPVNPVEVIRSVRKAMDQIKIQRQLEGMKGDEEVESEDKGARIVKKVKSYMEGNYTAYDLNLDGVADMLSINPSYLSTIFKKYSGTNFSDYLSELRTNAAKELLKDPLRSMGEIARATGYESASYFTRAFKKRTGQTPTEYRSSHGYKGGKA